MHDLFGRPKLKKVFFKGGCYDQAWIEERVEGFARFVREKAQPHSPFLYLFASNHIKTLLAYFGAVRAGFVVVLIEPGIGRLELAEMLHDTPPAVMVRIDAETVEFDRDAEFEFRPVARERILWDELGDDVCTIVYTNAEDGYAKGAMLTKASLAADAEAFAVMGEYDSATVCVPLLSMAHLYGLQSCIFAPALTGGGVYIADIANPIRIRSAVNEFAATGATHVYGVPFTYYVMSKVTSLKRESGSVISWATGAYALSARVERAFTKLIEMPIREGYGLTEASPACTWYTIGETPKTGSVGRAMPCCELKVEAADGGRGKEVYVRGENVMKGYYGRKDATAKVLCDGWLRTGDLGYLDADGCLFLTGRRKEMAKVGGRNVYRAEVERIVRGYHGVIAAALTWEANEIGGDSLRMGLTLKPCITPDEIRSRLLEDVSAYKVASRIINS